MLLLLVLCFLCFKKLNLVQQNQKYKSWYLHIKTQNIKKNYISDTYETQFRESLFELEILNFLYSIDSLYVFDI